MFAIGQALQGHVDERKGTILNDHRNSISHRPRKTRHTHSMSCKSKQQKAMQAWTQVGMLFNFVKDIRKLLAK